MQDLKKQIERKKEEIENINRYIANNEKRVKELKNEGVINNHIRKNAKNLFLRQIELLMRRNHYLDILEGLLQKDLELKEQTRQIPLDANKMDEEQKN